MKGSLALRAGWSGGVSVPRADGGQSHLGTASTVPFIFSPSGLAGTAGTASQKHENKMRRGQCSWTTLTSQLNPLSPGFLTCDMELIHVGPHEAAGRVMSMHTSLYQKSEHRRRG